MLVVGLAGVGLGMFLLKAGLDDADKWASVIGVFIGSAGLGISVYGVVLARRSLQSGVDSTAVHVTSAGARSIAAQTIMGTVTTGDTSKGNSPEIASTVPVTAFQNPQPASEANVVVNASGERSVAAQNIFGVVSTGDGSSEAS